MTKREQADSGLRAGFIREDEAQKQLNRQTNKQSETVVSEAAKDSVAPATEEKEAAPQMEKKGPKVSFQGVSGKMITGVVRAVKRHTHKGEENLPEQAEKAAQNAGATTEAAVPSDSPQGVAQSERNTAAANPKADVKPAPATTSSVEHKTTIDQVAHQNQPEEKNESLGVKEVSTQPVKEEPLKEMTVDKESDQAMASKQEPAASQSSSQAAPLKQESHPTREEKIEKVQKSPKHQSSTTASAPASANGTTTDTRQKPAGTPRPTQTVSAAPNQPRHAQDPRPGEGPQPGRVPVNVSVASSYFERTGKMPIRPQKGNYIGKDSSTPAFKDRPQGTRPGGYRSNSGDGGSRYGQGSGRPGGYRSGTGSSWGGRSEGARPGGRSFSGSGFGGSRGAAGGDKDAEDTPRRTRSPKQQKNTVRGGDSLLGTDKKTESRRTFAAKKDGRAHDRFNGSDYRTDHDEIEFDTNVGRRNRKKKDSASVEAAPARAQLTQVKLPESMSVKDLAEGLKKTTAEVIMKLMGYGVMATVNQEINYDTAEIIAGEFGIKAEPIVTVTEEQILFDESEDREEDLVARPPVVVVMGHVDHGKTSILDWIRSTHVASGEAGGITQHIGAYMVDVKGKKITFLDTPGHEAFTAMRARGAQVTDIAILVVAADDGVMPQTIEAIHHAKAANTEIIVAINKMDRPNANIDRVKQELAQQGLLAPDWGGSVTMVPVSAKKGTNMDELLDMINLTADVLELKANPNRQAKGTVIEARLDHAKGPVATILVQRGTLKQGDTVVVGAMIGNIRAMADDHGRPMTSAGPSVPVEILGLPEVPADGDVLYQVTDEKVARNLIERRKDEERERALKKANHVTLENLFDKMSEGETKELGLIVKADVQGSVEAITQSLEKLSNDEVRIKVIHGAVGAVTETDVRLAEVSNAIIIGFNVRPAANVQDLAKDAKVDIRLYRVIYEALEDMEKAMKGLLAPKLVEEVLGHAEVRETYKVSGVGTIAGCYVTDGKVSRNASIRLVRDGVVVHEGTISSLKRFKDDAKEVAQGFECGIGIERYNDVKNGDVIEAYRINEVAQA